MKEPGFFQYLRTVSQVTALVGQKIYPLRAPQNIDRPFVVWLRTAVERQQLYCGVSELVKGTYQFSCYGVNYAGAMALHSAVWTAMQDYRGQMGDVLVRHAHCTTDFAREDEDPALYAVLQLWDVWYLETPEDD